MHFSSLRSTPKLCAKVTDFFSAQAFLYLLSECVHVHSYKADWNPNRAVNFYNNSQVNSWSASDLISKFFSLSLFSCGTYCGYLGLLHKELRLNKPFSSIINMKNVLNHFQLWHSVVVKLICAISIFSSWIYLFQTLFFVCCLQRQLSSKGTS